MWLHFQSQSPRLIWKMMKISNAKPAEDQKAFPPEPLFIIFWQFSWNIKSKRDWKFTVRRLKINLLVLAKIIFALMTSIMFIILTIPIQSYLPQTNQNIPNELDHIYPYRWWGPLVLVLDGHTLWCLHGSVCSM